MNRAVGAPETRSLVRILVQTDPNLVVAAWGSTARREMTRSSDLDLLCWNPRKTTLPELTVHRAAYLDVVTCGGSQTKLLAWATANATDLHAVMFAKRLSPDTHRSAQFDAVVAALWRNNKLRTREFYHLVATTIAVGRLYGPRLYRPEKFAIGATRSWSALAECGQLVAGAYREGGTAANLRRMAADGLVDPAAARSFQESMRLRRQCEDGTATFTGLAAAYGELKEHYLTCARALLGASRAWLDRHASLSHGTSIRLERDMLQTGRQTAASGPSQPTGEAETMMRAFLAVDGGALDELLRQSPHGASWWVRHAAILNPRCAPTTLLTVVDAVAHAGTWWRDRNLILYAIRHPAADRQLLDRLRGMAGQLRPMDCAALAAREREAASDTQRGPR